MSKVSFLHISSGLFPQTTEIVQFCIYSKESFMNQKLPGKPGSDCGSSRNHQPPSCPHPQSYSSSCSLGGGPYPKRCVDHMCFMCFDGLHLNRFISRGGSYLNDSAP